MVDSITLAVIASGLQQICNEMDIAIERSSFCPVVSESLDRSSGVYSTEGELIAQGETGLPLFVGSMQFTVQAALREYSEWEPGDIVMVNDPYSSGTHLMDMKMVRPIFSDGELFCFIADTAHWTDIGGMVPGGFAPTATEIFQEGIRIPPIKVYRAGVPNEEFLRLLMSNIRIPDERQADLRSQVGALNVGEIRFAALLEKYGPDTVREAIAELADRSEANMRSLIEAVPDGTYTATAWLDSDGIDLEPLELRVAVTVEGSDMFFDFAGSSPAVKGPLNTSYAALASAVLLHMKHVFHEVPISGGCFRPFHVNRAEGTFLDATYPHAVSGCASEVTVRVGDAIFMALQPVLPDRIGATNFGTICNFTLSGFDPRKQRPFIMFNFSGGGYGAHGNADGLTNGASTISIAKSSSVEVLEHQNPILFERYALREGSAGAGTHRGGFGVDIAVRALVDQTASTVLADRGRSGPPGADGGLPAATTEVVWNLAGEEFRPPHITKASGVVMQQGDVLRVRTPGGGGYGDPRLRDRDAVRSDIENGYLDQDQANEIYGPTESAERTS